VLALFGSAPSGDLWSIGRFELMGAHGLVCVSVCRYQELSDILTLRPAAEHFLQERNSLRAVTPSLVMAGQTNKQLHMEILSKRAHGSNEIPGRPTSTRRLPFNFIPDREVLAGI
jgi:hypothetical protein